MSTSDVTHLQKQMEEKETTATVGKSIRIYRPHCSCM